MSTSPCSSAFVPELPTYADVIMQSPAMMTPPLSANPARETPTDTDSDGDIDAATAQLHFDKQALWEKRVVHGHRTNIIRARHARFFGRLDTNNNSVTVEVITRYHIMLEDVILDIMAQGLDREAIQIDKESFALDQAGEDAEALNEDYLQPCQKEIEERCTHLRMRYGLIRAALILVDGTQLTPEQALSAYQLHPDIYQWLFSSLAEG